MNKAEFKCEQLEKEVFLLKQELEFREMETNEYKERELQLKRMNQSLLKALEEQKPNVTTLTFRLQKSSSWSNSSVGVTGRRRRPYSENLRDSGAAWRRRSHPGSGG